MTKNRIKSKPEPMPLISNREEMETLVNEITLIKLNEIKIKAAMDGQITCIRESYESQLGEISLSLETKLAAAHAWAEAHPEEFAKKKSIDFASAVVGFRTGTPKLVLLNRSWNWEKVLEFAQSILPNFIRSKPELDKEAIIAQRDELADVLPMVGVKVTQGETFFVEPKLTKVETRETSEAK